MVLTLATAEDLVFHELLRWSGLPDRGSLRHAIEGLRGADQLRCIVRTVLAIADELKAELAEIERGGAPMHLGPDVFPRPGPTGPAYLPLRKADDGAA